ERHARPALGLEVELVDVHDAAEVQDRAVDGRELFPVAAPDQAPFQAAVLERPRAREEVEVVDVAGARPRERVLTGRVRAGGRGGRRGRRRGDGRRAGGTAAARGERQEGETP